jgi:tetratricopeptide (TPR) repeat protein
MRLALLAICVIATGASAQPADWGAKRNPFDAVTVSRYKAILVKNPHDEAALRELVSLYKRFRSLEKLQAEYKEKLTAGDDWATLVVLARFPSTPRTDAVALWKRAMMKNPDDARGWIATGDASYTDAPFARDAYKRAAALTTDPKQKKLALTKLISAARGANDAPTVDAAYAELIGLSPKDGMLWLDRGSAQYAAKQYGPARDSFATAETLLKTDPTNRLTAMVNQGLALDAMNRGDEAIAQFEHVLDSMPRGYYLGREVVGRIADVERKRKQLPAAITRLEKRWPERQRGYFEWATLGDLYLETKDDAKALDAYKKAVAKAPTEIATQRKLIALLDKTDPAAALVAHEKAARVAPGDGELQIALAKRYHTTDEAKSLAILAALSRRMSGNPSVRALIAAVYEEWDNLPLAIVEYEAIFALEPDDPDAALTLGDAYWRADNRLKAITAWERLDKIDTADSHFRHGEVLALHDVWDAAVEAYTKSLAKDPTRADGWYGRARANEAIQQFAQAAEDARRAVALTNQLNYGDGLRNRQLLVRTLSHYTSSDLESALSAWRFAFDRGEVASGYMLAAHHVRLHDDQEHDTLTQLYKRVPTDDTLGIAVARSFSRKKEFKQARQELQKIAKRNPKATEEIAKQIAIVDDEEERWEKEKRDEEAGTSINGVRLNRPQDITGTEHRTGFRLALGSEIHNGDSALIGVGVYRTYRITRGTALNARIDWSQRDDEVEEINAFGFSALFTRRIVGTKSFELAAGLGPRLEIRYSSDAKTMSQWDDGAITGDAVIEVMPRKLDATIGVRYNQSLTEPRHTKALFLELGFEIR